MLSRRLPSKALETTLRAALDAELFARVPVPTYACTRQLLPAETPPLMNRQ